MVQTRSQVKAEAEVEDHPEAPPTSTDPTSSIDSITENVATLSLETTTNEIVVPVFPGEVPPPEEEEEVFDPVLTVEDFCALIETVPVDQWKKRTAALDSLVATVKEEGQQSQQQQLAVMAPALSNMLKDPRSSVVKLTCASLKDLFRNANNNKCSDLLLDLFPTFLDIAALTSVVIRKQVQDLVEQVMPLCSCRPNAVSTILDRLNDSKINKSKTVREACVLYLTLAVEHWAGNSSKTIDENDCLLSCDTLQTVGNTLIGAMRDSAPAVREQARKGLQVLRQDNTETWERLVQNPPSGRDMKIQKLLLRSLEEPAVTLEKLSKQPARPAKSAVGGPSKFSKFRNFQKQTGTSSSGNAGSGDVLVL